MCAMVLLAYHSVITYYLGKYADIKKHDSYWPAWKICIECMALGLCMHCRPIDRLFTNGCQFKILWYAKSFVGNFSQLGCIYFNLLLSETSEVVCWYLTEPEVKGKRMGMGRQSWVYQTNLLPVFSGRRRLYSTRVNINVWWPSSLNNDPTKLNYKFTKNYQNKVNIYTIRIYTVYSYCIYW